MELQLLGLSHKTAPVEIREKVAIAPLRLNEALSFYRQLAPVTTSEIALLSTCNRTEIYSVSTDYSNAYQFLEEYFKIKRVELLPFLYQISGSKAVEHLMRVASGLDSMIVGEGQVLGQVKTAWQAAREMATSGSLLNSVLNRAISCGKRSRTETKISQGAVSVGAAAVELARKIFGQMEMKQVLIIGAGKMSEIAATLLKSQVVFVANRTFARAEELAKKIGGQAIHFADLDNYLATCDIVISSTGSPHFIINRSRLENIIERRSGSPLFLIDIAVPRDIDPKVGELPSVYLYDIDDLNSIAAENIRARQSEVPKVERIIEEERMNFLKWHKNSPSNRRSSSVPVAAASL